MSVRIAQIDSGNVKPVQYNHAHDPTVIFPFYRENFNFGLTVNEYYFNEKPKDKKTNFNTQYTLTNLYPLSAIVELDIPFTSSSIDTFTSTIKHGDLYLRTDYTTLPLPPSAGFVASSEFNSLCSNFFYTFKISTFTHTEGNGIHRGTKHEKTSISQTFLSGGEWVTWYGMIALSAAGDEDGRLLRFSKTVPGLTITGHPSAAGFEFTIKDNTLQLIGTEAKTIASNSLENDTVSATALKLHKNDTLVNATYPLSAAQITHFTTAAALSTSNLTIDRKVLTKDYKYIPNSFVKYTSSYNADNVNLNTTSTVQHISNNYFVFGNNYKFSELSEDIVINADLFPLKNQATLNEHYSENNHFNAEPSYLNRIYEKIHSGTNQIDGYNKIGLSYNIGTYDVKFKPNKLTYFTTPNSMAPYTKLNIADSKVDNLGAIPGDNPLMADKVFKRRTIAKNNSFSDDVNPTYLCSWLSGNNGGDKKWVDRYYNPRLANFAAALSGTSYYSVVTSANMQTTEMFDVSSNLVFEPNNDYIYYHIGSNDYENLFKSYEKFNTAKNIKFTNYKGVPSLLYESKNDYEVDLDGTNFGRFTTDMTGDFSINLWLHTNSYGQPFCHKILGNYFDEGISIFNTDLVTPNILLPSNNKLFFINNDFEIYDELELIDKDEKINIIGVGRKDNYSNFYLLGDNHIIYEYNEAGSLIGKIEDINRASTKSVIDDFEVGENKLHILFNPVQKKKWFVYDFNSNYTNSVTSSVSSDTVGSKGRILNINDKITILNVDSENSSGNEVSWLKDETPILMRQHRPDVPGIKNNFIQKGIQSDKTTEIIKSGVAVKSLIQGCIVNDDDQIIILHDHNRISITDKNRNLIKSRIFCNQITKTGATTKYIDLIYDFEDGEYKKYILLVEYNKTRTRLYKIDYNLKIVLVKDMSNMPLNNLNLTKTITSYSYLKKINANKNRFKVIMKTKPKFTTTGAFHKCKSIIDFNIGQLNAGYNHFFLNVSFKNGYMELFVNGRSYQKLSLPAGKFILDKVLGSGVYVGAVSTPYYLTLANKLNQPKKYFVNNCKIKGFKLYNKTLSHYEMLAHYYYHLDDKDVIWSYPLGQRTYIDTIDKLIKFNLPEKISNRYDLEIKNIGITDPILLNKLKDRIKLELPKITPYFDEVEDIIIS